MMIIRIFIFKNSSHKKQNFKKKPSDFRNSSPEVVAQICMLTVSTRGKQNGQPFCPDIVQ